MCVCGGGGGGGGGGGEGGKGRAYFPLYIYIENFKNLLVKNHQSDFNNIWQKCLFGNPLTRLFKP